MELRTVHRAICLTMSITVANEWASRVVILLQLAAWSAVGITLVQKGVTSLRKSAEADSFVQETSSDPIIERRLGDVVSTGRGNEAESGTIFLDREPRNPGRSADPYSSSTTQQRLKRLKESEENEFATKNDLDGLDDLDDLENESDNDEHADLKHVGSGDVYLDLNNFTANEVLKVDFEKGNVAEHSGEGVEEKVVRFRKKVAAGNAAAAISMLVVGAIMLLLGPSVIILRAIDERRQRRRFRKLSPEMDLPPSYEQATLMDEVPRYSTLRLNAA